MIFLTINEGRKRFFTAEAAEGAIGILHVPCV
jgi:hypothetical protein